MLQAMLCFAVYKANLQKQMKPTQAYCCRDVGRIDLEIDRDPSFKVGCMSLASLVTRDGRPMLSLGYSE